MAYSIRWLTRAAMAHDISLALGGSDRDVSMIGAFVPTTKPAICAPPRYSRSLPRMLPETSSYDNHVMFSVMQHGSIFIDIFFF
jgi:hypothetical protein